MDEREELKHYLLKLEDVTNYFLDRRPDLNNGVSAKLAELYAELLVERGYRLSKEEGRSRIVDFGMRCMKAGGYMMKSANVFNQVPSPENNWNGLKDKSDSEKGVEEFVNSLTREFYDKTKSAAALGVTRQTVDNWLKQGKFDIQTTIQGSRTVLPKSELIRIKKELLQS